MAVHSTDTNNSSPYFDCFQNDTNSVGKFFSLYEEYYYMAYDTNSMYNVDTLAYKILDTNTHDTTNIFGNQVPGKVPIVLAHFKYHRLVDNALDSSLINTYFDLDTTDNVLYDDPDLDSSDTPYYTDSLFSVCAINLMQARSEYTFIIDQEWMILDDHMGQYYTNGTDYRIEIDFDDGNGFRSFNPAVHSEVEISYTSKGEKIAKVQIINIVTGAVVAVTAFIINARNISIPPPPNQYRSGPGYNVGVFDPCLVPGNPNIRKVALVVNGYDMFNEENPAIAWQRIGTNPNIEQLRDYGYEFHVLTFTNSNTDMRLNADVVIDYLDQLKCEILGNDPENPEDAQPIVVIGYSMGGVIANYALAKWESEPTVSSCFQDYLHYTRLLVTIDSPHEGANVPLAYQHLYKNLDDLRLTKILSVASTFWNKRVYDGLLNNTAVRQLLMYHVATENGSNYTMHPERAEFLASLDAYGGRPEHCKILATSQGSSAGINQKRDWDNNPRVPGDRIMHFYGEIYGKFLIFTQKIYDMELKLSTASGSNAVYERNYFKYFFKIKIRWTGISLKAKTPQIGNGTKYANINPYDVASGGYFDGLTFTFSPYSDNKSYLGGLVNIISEKVDKGSGNYEVHYGADFFYLGGGIRADLGTDGLPFTFVPLRSALSYGGNIYSGNPSPNLEAMTVANVVAQTPFDVIVGVNEEHRTTLNNFNESHTIIMNHLNFDPNQSGTLKSLRSCDAPFSYLINREIGEETIYLDNFNQVFPSAFYSSEYDILINNFNPVYQYPSIPSAPFPNRGAFSKEAFYFQYPSFTEFYCNSTGALSFTPPNNSPGFDYAAPQTGSHIPYNQAVIPCCPQPRIGRILDDKNSESYAFEYLGFNQSSHFFKLIDESSEHFEYHLFDVSGREVLSGIWSFNPENKYAIDKPNAKAVFILKVLSQKKEVNTMKILNF